MFLHNTKTYTALQRKLSSVSIVVLLFSICSPTISALGEFVSYSDTLKNAGIISRDLVSSRAITYREALHIGIGLGGFPSGCGPSMSLVCDTETIARSRGLISSKIENTVSVGVIRANAIRLILRAAKINPSVKPSGFSDVDGKISTSYIGYIARARELGCIQSASEFRAFDFVSEGEFAKMSLCALVSSNDTGGVQQSGTIFQSAPNSEKKTVYPSTPFSPSDYIFSSYPSGGDTAYALAADLATLATQVSSLSGAGHSPTTLVVANGLSLSGQALSLALAGISTTGALSVGDWNAFNNKENSIATGTTSEYFRGDKTWQTLDTSAVLENTNLYWTLTRFESAFSGKTTTDLGEGSNLYFTNTRADARINSLFSGLFDTRLGIKNTTDISEGTNLYYTDTRARSAISTTSPLGYNPLTGVLSITPGINGQQLSVSGGVVMWVDPAVVGVPVTSVFGRAGAVIAQSGDYDTDLVTEGASNLYWTSARFDTAFGLKDTNALSEGLANLYFTDSRAQNALSGTLATIRSDIATATGNISSLSGQVTTLESNILVLSGTLISLSNTITTLSGIVAQNTADISTLSGQTYANTASIALLSGALITLTTTVDTLSGGLGTLSSALSALSGGLSTTNTNLSTLSGSLVAISNTLATLSGTVNTLISDLSTLSGQTATNTTNITNNTSSISTLSGALAMSNANLSALSGSLSSLSGTVSTLASQIALLSGQAHDAVSLSSSNGLSLSGQVLSLALAGISTTGALSVGDWNTFNSKENSLTFGTGISRVGNSIGLTLGADGNVLIMSGGIASWQVPPSAPVSSVFGRVGVVSAQNGDYNSDQVTEGSTNLYFTDSRSQNALSGTVTGINSTISTLSGSLVSLSTTINTLSGSLSTLTSTVISLSGSLDTTNSNLITTNGTISTLSGVVSVLTTAIATLSGGLSSLTATVTSLSGALDTANTNITNNTASISALSGSLAGLDSTITSLSGVVSTIITTVSTLSGSLDTTNTNLSLLSTTVSNNYITLSGALATTNSNLSALSGSLSSLSGTVSTLASQIALLSGQAHDAVTLSNPNGLSLSGQVLSLTLASTSTTGALSVGDWNTFNGKTNLTSFSALGPIAYNNLTGVFSWSGTTTDISEGSNLYFTDSRAQNALSGTVSVLSGSLATVTANIATLSGNLASLTTTFNTLSGSLVSLANTVTSLSGALDTANTNIANNTANIATLSGNLATTDARLSITNVNLATATENINTLSGSLATANSTITSLSGVVSTLGTTIASLSGSLVSLTNTVTALSGALTTTNINVANNTVNISTLSGNLATLTTTVSTLSGSLVSLSGTVSSIFTTIATLSGALATTNANLVTTSSNLATATGNIATLSGQITTINTNIATLSGSISTISTNVSTLSGQVAALSAASHAAVTLDNPNGLSLSGQVLSLSLASTSTTGALSVGDWNTFNSKENILTFGTGISRVGNSVGLVTGSAGQVLSMSGGSPTWITLAGGGISSMNGLSSAVQNFSIGNAGTDFTISSTGTTHTFNLPYASLTATGLLKSDDYNLFNNKLGFISGTPNGLSITGTGISLTLAGTSTTGALSSTDWNIFNSKIGLTSLSTTGGLLSYNNATGVFGFTGTTTNFTEGANLYFTNARAIAATLTGFSAGSGTVTSADSLLQAIQKLQGSNTAQDGLITTANTNISTLTTNLSTTNSNLATATGQINTLNTNVATITGQLVTINSNLATATGNILTLTNNLNTATGNIATLSGQIATLQGQSHSAVTLSNPNGLSLSGQVLSLTLASTTTTGALSVGDWNTFNSKINLTSLSASGPLTYNNLTGVFGIALASTTTTGALSVVDYNLFNNKLGFISGTPNGLSISGSGLSLTLASTSTTGALSVGDWNTFNNKIGSLNGQTGSTQTFGIGTAGTDFNIVSSGNIHTFNLPDASGTARGLVNTGSQTFTGAKTFSNVVTINSQQAGTGGLRFTQLTSTSTGSTGNGKMLTVDGSGNVILTNASTVAGVDVIAQKSTALASALVVAPQTVVFNTLTSNINSAYSGTTGIYSAPAADTYEINASLQFNYPANPGANQESACVAIQRAGVTVVESCTGNSNDVSAAAFSGNVNVMATLTFNASQTGTIVTYVKNITPGITFVANASTNFLTIKRVGTAALVTSDSRLKKNIEIFTGGLADIRALNTVSFEYNGLTKNAINDGRTHIGIIAQEVQSGALGKWAISKGPDGYLRYDPNAVIYSLVNSVKALDKKSAITDLDDIEYDNSLGNSGSLAFNSVYALDRFSFMVKKSLSKIDPKYASGGLDNFGNAVNTLASGVASLSGNIDGVSLQYALLRAEVDSLKAELANLSQASGATSSAGVPLTAEDRSILGVFLATVSSLIVKVQTTFSETVVFMKSVIFKGSVTFEGRVTFEDTDMAGNATIPAGSRSTRINFQNPYSVIPTITATANDFVTFRITGKSTTGFTIEIESPLDRDVSLDWIALHVKGVQRTNTTPPSDIPFPLIESPPPSSDSGSSLAVSGENQIPTPDANSPPGDPPVESVTPSSDPPPPIIPTDPPPESDLSSDTESTIHTGGALVPTPPTLSPPGGQDPTITGSDPPPPPSVEIETNQEIPAPQDVIPGSDNTDMIQSTGPPPEAENSLGNSP